MLKITAATMVLWPEQPDEFVEAIPGEGLGAEDYDARCVPTLLRPNLDGSPVRVMR